MRNARVQRVVGSCADCGREVTSGEHLWKKDDGYVCDDCEAARCAMCGAIATVTYKGEPSCAACELKRQQRYDEAFVDQQFAFYREDDV